METPFKREQSKSSFTDDEELSRMSDLESEYRENANTSRRMSLASLPASPSASSYNKMSIDSDDARSTSSASGKLATEPRSIRPLGSHWATISDMKQQSTLSQYNIRQQDELFIQETNNCNIKKSPQIKAYDLLERRDPERRNVNRRSSLLPKSKALLRVIDQADEDTHLGDIEMRREHETTVQLKNKDSDSVEKAPQDVPAASWTKVTDMPLYQCSKLNPEVEMTNFQLENASLMTPSQQQAYKSIKRKASEDRFEPYPTSIGLKRRAVSPSVSLTGSPVLSGISSPPTSFMLYGGSSSPNAAARAQQKASSTNLFNLQDASGGLSRMSLSE